MLMASEHRVTSMQEKELKVFHDLQLARSQVGRGMLGVLSSSQRHAGQLACDRRALRRARWQACRKKRAYRACKI